jgi:hypothetical protein
MDFENEPLENEDEREFDGAEEGLAGEIVESSSDDIDGLDISLERADESDATDDPAVGETPTASDPPETPIAPASQAADVERAVEPQIDLSRAKVVSVSPESGFASASEAPTASDVGEPVTRITVTDVDRERFEGLSDWAQGMLKAGPRGEQGIAPPVTYVRLPDDQIEQAKRDALADVAQRDAQVCMDMATTAVRREFWVRDCQERAITGNR